MSYTETVAPEPLGTGGHGPLHSETVGRGTEGHRMRLMLPMLEMEIKQ